MMNSLDKAIEKVGGVSKLSRALGVKPSVVSNWRMRGTTPDAVYCTGIEQATGGDVTRQDLRPSDWQLIWPELVPANEQAGAEAEDFSDVQQVAVQRVEPTPAPKAPPNERPLYPRRNGTITFGERATDKPTAKQAA